MADTGRCEQCGAPFARRREHARFCSARCRIAWHRAQPGARPPALTALEWSVGAMRDAAARVELAGGWDADRTGMAVSEAVWWVTLVDATLVRYHPGAYDAVLAAGGPDERRAMEGTLGGLRFVRNQLGSSLGPVDFLSWEPGEDQSAGWAWKPLPVPPLGKLPPRGRNWERDRYRAYQAWLAGQPVTETFGLAAAFVGQAFAQAAKVRTGTQKACGR